MHTLAIGSTIAVLSAWTTAPTGGVFDSGLAGRFAAAFERHSDNCLAADLIVDGGGMLVMLNEHGDDILADNALMMLGGLQEREGLSNEAQATYERLLTEHSDSFFISEARKRIRILRGETPL